MTARRPYETGLERWFFGFVKRVELWETRWGWDRSRRKPSDALVVFAVLAASVCVGFCAYYLAVLAGGTAPKAAGVGIVMAILSYFLILKVGLVRRYLHNQAVAHSNVDIGRGDL